MTAQAVPPIDNKSIIPEKMRAKISIFPLFQMCHPERMRRVSTIILEILTSTASAARCMCRHEEQEHGSRVHAHGAGRMT